MAEDELDIRSVWNRSKAKEDPSLLQIDKLERKGTKTTLYWIKIILWIEFTLTIVGMPFMIVYVSARGDSTGWIAFYCFISIVYLFYYQFLIQQIRRFSYDGNVLASLKKLYGYLRFYLLHYKVVFWLSAIFSIIYTYYEPAHQEVYANIQTTKEWVLIIIIWTLMLTLFGGLFHLIIHLIYGRKITRLRNIIDGLKQ